MSSINIPSKMTKACSVIKYQLSSSQQSRVRGLKYICTQNHDFNENNNFSKSVIAKLKSIDSLNLKGCNQQNEDQQVKALTCYGMIAKTSKRIGITTKDPYNINLKQFSKVKKATLQGESRRSCLKLCRDQRNQSIRSISFSPKLQTIIVEGFNFPNLTPLTHYQQLQTLDITSTYSNLISSQEHLAYFQLHFKGFSKLRLNVVLLVDKPIENEQQQQQSKINTKLIAPFMAQIQTLNIKVCGVSITGLPLISNFSDDDIETTFANLQTVLYSETGSSIFQSPDSLQDFAKLKGISKLDLELYVSNADTVSIFDNLALPSHLKELKIVFANCKYSLLNQANPNQKFFTSLNNLKNLESLEFEAFRLSILRETNESCLSFVKNMLSSIDCRLKTLKLKGPPTTETDDELYQLLLKQTSLNYLDFGLTTKPSEAMAKKLVDFRGNLSTLLLFNNPSIFTSLSKSALKGLEELCIYYGCHVQPNATTQSQSKKFIEILKKVHAIRSIKKLTLYYSLNSDELFSEIASEINEILTKCKQLSKLDIMMRSTKINTKQENVIMNALSKNKRLSQWSMKFFNKDFDSKNVA